VPISKEQYNLIKNSKALSMNLATGPVRAGKNWALNTRMLMYLLKEPRGRNGEDLSDTTFIFGGTSKDSIYRNFLKDLLAYFPQESYRYSKSTGKGRIKTETGKWRDFYAMNANDSDSFKVLRGATIGGYHLTELTLLNKDFFDEIQARKSVDNAMGFADTNADSPFHWVYQKYLDPNLSPKLKPKFDRVFEFDFNSNPSLSEDYKEQLKLSYKEGTLLYRRKILNEWVLAEGVIYDNFNELENTIEPDKIPRIDKWFICADYGTSNPCTFLLIGFSRVTHKYYVVEEFYYSGRDEGVAKTNDEYSADLKEFIGNRDIEGIFLDPSAISFKESLKRIGFYQFKDVDNSVIEGIEDVKKAYKDKDLYVSKACSNYLREVSTYSWDVKASIKQGKDIPLKQNDHTQDAIRYFTRSWIYSKTKSFYARNIYD
jgi:PBSX family phage terminase large subunit